MHWRNVIAVIFGFTSGILLIWATLTGDFQNQPNYILYAQLIIAALGLTPPVSDILLLIMSGMTFLAGLGGVSVLLGVFAVLVGIRRIGSNLIGIGAGIGIFSIIYKTVLAVVGGADPLSWFFATFQGYSVIGAILAVLAQEFVRIRVKKKPKEEVPEPEAPAPPMETPPIEEPASPEEAPPPEEKEESQDIDETSEDRPFD